MCVCVCVCVSVSGLLLCPLTAAFHCRIVFASLFDLGTLATRHDTCVWRWPLPYAVACAQNGQRSLPLSLLLASSLTVKYGTSGPLLFSKAFSRTGHRGKRARVKLGGCEASGRRTCKETGKAEAVRLAGRRKGGGREDPRKWESGLRVH